MSEYGAVAESARTPFHAALKPSDNVAGCDLLGDGVEQCLAFELAVRQVRLLEIGFDARVGKLRAEVRVLHHEAAWLIENSVISVQSRTDGQSFITGSGLDPSAAKRSLREKFSIGDAVEGASSRHGEIFATAHVHVVG